MISFDILSLLFLTVLLVVIGILIHTCRVTTIRYTDDYAKEVSGGNASCDNRGRHATSRSVFRFNDRFTDTCSKNDMNTQTITTAAFPKHRLF